MALLNKNTATFALSEKEKEAWINEGINRAGLKRTLKTIGYTNILNPLGWGALGGGYGISKNIGITPEQQKYAEKGYDATNKGKYKRHIGGFMVVGSIGGSLSALSAASRGRVPMSRVAATALLGTGGYLLNRSGTVDLQRSVNKLKEDEGLI